MSTIYYGGCDVGSTTGKAVILNDKGIVASALISSEIDPEETALKVLNQAIEKVADLSSIENLTYLVGTGYGRNEVPFANENISEISCHGMGAFYCNPEIKTIIDIGGQDVKGIALNDDGSIKEFSMNDKCAAGTGRFFEAMGRIFKMELDEFSKLSLSAKKTIPITSQCSVFAESEVISLLAKKESPFDIASGINNAVAKRCFTLAKRVGVTPEVTITGGCAKNVGLIKALEKILQVKITKLDVDPQIIGAIGAAVFAMRKNNNE